MLGSETMVVYKIDESLLSFPKGYGFWSHYLSVINQSINQSFLEGANYRFALNHASIKIS
jgi:hypothetical protein